MVSLRDLDREVIYRDPDGNKIGGASTTWFGRRTDWFALIRHAMGESGAPFRPANWQQDYLGATRRPKNGPPPGDITWSTGARRSGRRPGNGD